MNEVTPAPPRKRLRRTTAGVGPAVTVGGLALLLAGSILYPWGSGERGGVREVHAAESVIAATPTGAPQTDPVPVRLAVERDPIGPSQHTTSEPIEHEVLVRCRVIDELGYGVEAAEVWADDGELRSYGLTGPEGTFELPLDRQRIAWHLEEGLPVLVGARHPAHGPSVMLPWRRPIEKELILILRGRGATLRLSILDPTGRPLEGAEVVLGDRTRSRHPTGALVLGGSGVKWTVVPAPPGSSNAWGEVLFEGLEPGRRSISLFASGYCPRHGFVELFDGEFGDRQITMEYACSVRGVLVRDDGLPVTGGRVLGRGEDPLTETQAFCDENGEYYLEHLPAGRVRLFAECRSDGRVTHTASTELHLEPRPETVWNAVLTRQQEIHGQLVDSRRVPLQGWRVELRMEEDPSEPVRTTSTSLDGRFSLPISPPGSPADLYVFHPLSAGSIATRVVRDVRADTVEHLHQLEPGEDQSAPIRGRVARPNGDSAVSIAFILHRLGGAQNYLVQADEFDGSFETPAVPPGDYVVIFPTHGWGWTPDALYHVTNGETLDVGTIELRQTGRLELLPSSHKRLSQSLRIRIDLVRQGISKSFMLPIYAGTVDLPLELHLAPGSYRFLIPDRGIARPEAFEIKSGEATQLVVASEE